jgi:hypothetical protein
MAYPKFAFELISKNGQPLSADLVVNAQGPSTTKYSTNLPFNGNYIVKDITGSLPSGNTNFIVEVWITSNIDNVVYTVYPLTISRSKYNENIANNLKNIIHIFVEDIPASFKYLNKKKRTTPRRIIIDAGHPF